MNNVYLKTSCIDTIGVSIKIRFVSRCVMVVYICIFFIDTHKRDTEWSSTTTVSLEHDVSKVLQETVPSARSLGAIPKKLRSTASRHETGNKNSRPIKKTESEKCHNRRYHQGQQTSRNAHRNRSMKENKVTQTVRQYDSSVEGLECLVVPTTSQTLSRMHVVPRRGSKYTRHRNEGYHESSSKGSNNELSTLLPTQPLLQAFLASRKDLPLPLCLPGDAVRIDSPQRYRFRRSGSVYRRQCCSRPSLRNNLRDTAIASSLSAGHGTHSAKNFNDTTDGSVHCFLDEQGNWITYTFDEKGLGNVQFI